MYHIYHVSTGELVSSTSVPPTELSADLDYIEYDDGYEIDKVWNTTTLDFDARPAPRIISKTDFIDRFITSEIKEMFGFNIGSTYTEAQQKNIRVLMRYLDFLDKIDLDNTRINTGVTYLESVGILASGRAAEILA